ncbi:MAG: hypothetical protein KJZ85_15190 [Rhodobacteraceae bacterium]|jgi:hypothetical protein|nr:hypothetical protein [Paracoccaceae bacterium]
MEPTPPDTPRRRPPPADGTGRPARLKVALRDNLARRKAQARARAAAAAPGAGAGPGQDGPEPAAGGPPPAADDGA